MDMHGNNKFSSGAIPREGGAYIIESNDDVDWHVAAFSRFGTTVGVFDRKLKFLNRKYTQKIDQHIL
jgi:hypothetical protein